MAVNIQFMEIEVGSAVNFRENINYNFNLIKTQLQQTVDGLESDIEDINNDITEINNRFNSLRPAIDIKLSATQPTDQIAGDYWFKIIN